MLPLPAAHPWNSPAEPWVFLKCIIPSHRGWTRHHPQLCEAAAKSGAPSTLSLTWTSSPACPDPSKLGKGTVQPFPLTGLPRRLWELSPSPARQEEGLGQRCPGTPEEVAFPWGILLEIIVAVRLPGLLPRVGAGSNAKL